MNSTVHGLRAFKVVLPNESEQEIQQLMDDWTAYYRPTSPGRRALVERAVTATVHHQRSKRYLAATLREQVRGAERAFDEEQDNIVQHYTELLPVEPSAAIRGLRRTAAGCRWVLRGWLELETYLLDANWTPSCRERATRLLGHKPEDLTDEVSYRLLYLTVTSSSQVPPEVQASLLDPRAMPDTLLELCDRPLPDPLHSFKAICKVVEDQIAEYEALAKQLRLEVEEPARAAAVEKAVFLKKEDLALWIRYERMHDSMFHRSYNTLERPEAPPPGPGPEPEAEPEPEPPAPMESEEDPAASAPPEPAIAIAEAAPSGAAASKPAPAAGPVVTGEPRIERQSKRVATDEPVAPAPTAETPAGTKAPADAGPGDVAEQGTPAIVATAASAPAAPAVAAAAEPLRVNDSLAETALGLVSRPEAIPDAENAPKVSHDAPASPDAATAVGCRGDPEGSQAAQP